MKKTRIMTCAVAVVAVAFAAGADSSGAIGAAFGGNEIRLSLKPFQAEVLCDGKTIVPRVFLDMSLDGRLVSTSQVIRVSRAAPAADRQETFVDYGDFGIRLLACEEGVAYRFETKKAARIDHENVSLQLPFHEDEVKKTLGKVREVVIPLAFAVNGKTFVAAESDVHDYPLWRFHHMYPIGRDATNIYSGLERYPRTWLFGHTSIAATSREKHLVEAKGARTFPWRIYALGDTEAAARANAGKLVRELARAPKNPAAFAWVKPVGTLKTDFLSPDRKGNARDAGGDPKKYTLEAVKGKIDEAVASGKTHLVIDEGWCYRYNFFNPHGTFNLPEIVRYADAKGVGIVLTVSWTTLYGQEAHYAGHFAKQGVKGLKVIHFNRADAEVLAFMRLFADACNARKLIVDYTDFPTRWHWTGFERAYPNVIIDEEAKR